MSEIKNKGRVVIILLVSVCVNQVPLWLESFSSNISNSKKQFLFDQISKYREENWK